MPAIPAITLALTAGTAVYGAVDANQQRQHAKGAAEAQKTEMDAQVQKAEDTDTANKKIKSANASATQSAAMSALKASMNSSNLLGGSILGGANPDAGGMTKPAKMLLGV